MAQPLTQEQFAAVDNKIAALNLPSALRNGTDASRAEAAKLSEAWEKAIALPQRTWQDRQDRLAAIAAVAELVQR